MYFEVSRIFVSFRSLSSTHTHTLQNQFIRPYTCTHSLHTKSPETILYRLRRRRNIVKSNRHRASTSIGRDTYENGSSRLHSDNSADVRQAKRKKPGFYSTILVVPVTTFFPSYWPTLVYDRWTYHTEPSSQKDSTKISYKLNLFFYFLTQTAQCARVLHVHIRLFECTRNEYWLCEKIKTFKKSN